MTRINSISKANWSSYDLNDHVNSLMFLVSYEDRLTPVERPLIDLTRSSARYVCNQLTIIDQFWKINSKKQIIFII